MREEVRRVDRERGATAVEYALAIALVCLLIVGAAVSLGAVAVSWAETVATRVGDMLT